MKDITIFLRWLSHYFLSVCFYFTVILKVYAVLFAQSIVSLLTK